MSELHFEKWQGTGNDFVVVHGPPPTTDQVRLLCDRRRGVGADGVLVVDDAAPAMIVLNADGSRPEMCGNGLRCVAAALAERGVAPFDRWTPIATDAGAREVRVTRRGDEHDVAIRMGRATFQPDLVVRHDGEAVVFRRASMGNPHAVRFDADGTELATLGKRVSESVEGGVNVELVRGEGLRFEVLVWERGVGPTLACGTGACAVAAVACRDGRAPFGRTIVIDLPGGPLEIEVAADSFEVTMRGPAARAFVGTWSSSRERSA
jgi:diaminopimelate epimerase